MKPSQNARTLALLRQRGERGVDQADFLLPDVVDGGKPILRLPARIDQLRRAGYAIETRRHRGKPLARYVLVGESVPTSAPDGPEVDDWAALFGDAVGVTPPVSAIAGADE